MKLNVVPQIETLTLDKPYSALMSRRRDRLPLGSSKQKCCPNADARKITREEHEDARQIAWDLANTEEYQIAEKLRKKVEMLFAHLKRILGLGRLRLRRPSGANDEFLLAAAVQNLRTLAKTFPEPQQTRKA